MLYEICQQLKQFGAFSVEELIFGIYKDTFIVDTPGWCIYVSERGNQYNQHKGLYTIEKTDSCPDELLICHKLLGILIERLKKNENTM